MPRTVDVECAADHEDELPLQRAGEQRKVVLTFRELRPGEEPTPWHRSGEPIAQLTAQSGFHDVALAPVADGIPCAHAGASIIYVHAYDGGGSQAFDWQAYARIIEGIRATVDVPVYPSILSPGIGKGTSPGGGSARFAHIEALAARGLLEFAVIDPDSVNVTELSAGARTEAAPTYLNPKVDVRYGLGLAARYVFHPA